MTQQQQNSNQMSGVSSSKSEIIRDSTTRDKDSEQHQHLGVSDFLFGATVGEGSFGRVCYARRKRSSQEYAIKIMDKVQIVKQMKVEAVMLEKNILSCHANSNNNFLIRLHGAFHNTQHLFLLLDLCYGTLSDIVPLLAPSEQNMSDFDCDACIFYYFGQTLRVLEYIHSIGIIHCDLKPDNILLTREGQIRLSDFGSAMDMRNVFASSTNDSNSSLLLHKKELVGSAEYLSPEMIRGESILTPSVDLWALGCILCLFLNGTTPFKDANVSLVIQRIMTYVNNFSKEHALDLPQPSPRFSCNEDNINMHSLNNDHTKNGRELVALLLHPDPTQRISAMDLLQSTKYFSIRSHVFFQTRNWDDLPTIEPPYRPPQPNWYLQNSKGGNYLMDGATEFDEWLLQCH